MPGDIQQLLRRVPVLVFLTGDFPVEEMGTLPVGGWPNRAFAACHGGHDAALSIAHAHTTLYCSRPATDLLPSEGDERE